MRRTPFALATLLTGLACAGSPAGCAGCGGVSVPYPDPPPPGGELLPGGARVRLTTTALDFLGRHLGALAAPLLAADDTRGTFPLDETLTADGTAPLILRDGCIGEPDLPCPPRGADPAAELGPTYPSTVAFDVASLSERLTLTWLAADASGRPGLHLALRDLELFVDVAFVTNVAALGAAACHVRDRPGQAALTVHELSFDLRLAIGPAGTLTTAVESPLVDLGGATDDSALQLVVTACDGVADPSCDDPRCHGAWGAFAATDCAEVCGVLDLFAQLGGFMTLVIEPVLGALAPTLAASVATALDASLAALPLTLETRLDLANSLLPTAPPLALETVLEPGFDVRGVLPGRGLELGLTVGLASPTPAVCAVDATAPDFNASAGPPPDYPGFVEIADPAGGVSRFEAYHAALSLTEATLVQALFAAFSAGLLCFNLTAEQVAALTAGAVELNAGLLMNFDARLAGVAEPTAPLMIGLWATRPPTLRLGAGDDIGGIEDPLLDVAVTELGVDLFVELDGEPIRLAGLVADLAVRLGIDRAPGGLLELVVAGVELVHSRQVYNELAPDADLSALLELMVDLALGQLLADSQRFPLDVTDSLGASLGLPLHVRLNALRRDLGPTGAAFLSAYATLCDDAELADPSQPVCYLPRPGHTPLPRLSATAIAPPTLGRARLRVAAPARDGRAWAFQSRVDRGPWSRPALADAGELTVVSPRLFVAGRHTVELRARTPGDDTTVSAVVALPIDVLPPLPRTAAMPIAAPTHGCQTAPAGYSLLAVVALLARRRRRT